MKVFIKRASLILLAPMFFFISTLVLAQGQECAHGACRADDLVPVCLLPPPTAARHNGRAQTQPRTINVTADVAAGLVAAGAASPGPC